MLKLGRLCERVGSVVKTAAILGDLKEQAVRIEDKASGGLEVKVAAYPAINAMCCDEDVVA